MNSRRSSDDRIARLESVRWHALMGDVEREPGWVRMTKADAPTHFRNGVLHAVLDDVEFERRLRTVTAEYSALGVPFRWDVGPSTRPLDTAERLQAAGFRLFQTMEGLVADATKFAGSAPDVREIGPGHIEDYLTAMQRGWGMAPAGVARFRDECREEFARPEQRTHFFVARDGSEPVGASALTMFDGYAHFAGASVDPAYRGRGLYRRMIDRRMEFVRERGVTEVMNHCVAETSAPICKRLGFEFVCQFDVFVYEP